MSKLQELPPDNRAVLSLLLRQQRTYADIATMLAISEQAVHDRAHAALILLSPGLARELDAERREEIGEYLLGQQAPSEGPATRAYLAADPTARAWAQALHSQLQDLAGGKLPVLPSGSEEQRAQRPPEQTHASGQSGARQGAGLRPDIPASRRNGAVLLGVILVVLVVVVIVIVNGKGSGSQSSASSNTGTSTTASSSAGGNTKSSSSTKSGSSAAKPHVDSQINLTAAESGSNAVAVAYVLSEGSQRAFYLVAEHLPKTEGFFYAVWLENSSGSAIPLGRAPTVGSDERLRTAGGLPTNASSYSQILVTHETDKNAKTPGQVVLRGKFSLG